MQFNLVSKVRDLISPAARGAAKSEPAGNQAPTAVLSQSSWLGRQHRCQVRLLSKEADNVLVWSPEYIDVGDAVWMEDNNRAVECTVGSYVAAAGGYRINLAVTGRSRRSKERTPCNLPGDLEWVDGLTRVRCPVRVTNLTAEGAQITLSRPAPEIRSVRLRFDGRTEMGSVRYCVQVGALYLAGVEFV